jgi:hypothetical protein
MSHSQFFLEFFLEFFVVSLDHPAMFGYSYELSECCIRRRGGKPIFGWFTLPTGPFDQ